MLGSGGRFDLAAPPRSIPPLVRGRLLFGGVLNQAGWLFLGFGMIFFWVFVMQSDPTEWLEFRSELATVQGSVTALEGTGASEGGSSSSSGATIVGCRYAYQVGGATYEGVSYGTAVFHEPGEPVRIEYRVGRPARSRIVGMRTALFPPFVLFVAIFPLVGLGLALGGLRQGRRAIRLLTHGEQSTGKLIAKEGTNTRINNRLVYKLTFEFIDDRGQRQEVTARTVDTESLEDDAEEPLLFDPYRPEDATMLDHLPGRPQIDGRGEIRTSNPSLALATLIIPGVTLIGHGFYVYTAYVAG